MDGIGSSLTLTNGLFAAGDAGEGEISITNGGVIASGQGIVALESGSQGSVIISGVGSNWVVSGNPQSYFSVGYEGIGTLVIENGGTISSVNGYIGHRDGAQGTATITGAGSEWTIDGNLTLGGFSGGATTAVGSLTLNDGGAVIVTNNVFIFGGGTLGGNGGIVGGNVVNAGAVTPGTSAGILTIDGTYSQTSTGTLTVQLGGNASAEYDQLIITGAASLDGVLEVKLINDFMPSAGDTFDILNWPGFAGSFDVDLPPIDADLLWNTDFLYTDGILQVDLAMQPGDHNGDGTVDAADYVAWRKNDGTQTGYDVWRAHFGETAGVGTGAKTCPRWQQYRSRLP